MADGGHQQVATRSQAERGAGTDQAPRARVRGMTVGNPAYTVEFDARTAYDFLVTLAIEEPQEQDLLAEDRRWLVSARAALPAERQQDLEDIFGDAPHAFGAAIGAMVVATPGARSAREFVAALAAADTRTIVREMLGEVIREDAAEEQLERILDGATDEIPAFAARTGEHHCVGTEAFLNAPAVAIDRIRAILGDWLAPFEAIEARVDEIIDRDLALRQADRSLPAVELVERTTGGVRWLGETGVTRVVLSPSYFARPVNYLYSGHDWRLFAYPVADAALETDDTMAPPPAMIRLHRALGDESRLRILRLLRDKDMYLTELAQHLEVSKPTMKHHLTQLRAAGLVTVTEQGAQTYYSLRRDRLSEAGDDLIRFLA
jgi:DNA-binding transcriptional ArsR family regulator